MMNEPKIPSFHTLLRYSALGTGIFAKGLEECRIDLAQGGFEKLQSLSLTLLKRGIYNWKSVRNDESAQKENRLNKKGGSSDRYKRSYRSYLLGCL